MRAKHLTSLAVLVLLGMLSPAGSHPASASCAAPWLEVKPGTVLRRGDPLLVEGRGFVDGCQDTMSCGTGLGCDDCEYDDPPPEPLQDVTLRLTQHDRSWPLASADAETAASGRAGQVAWRFELPPGAKPGRARLSAGPGTTLDVRIRRPAPRPTHVR
jgi:hypothetical protein